MERLLALVLSLVLLCGCAGGQGEVDEAAMLAEFQAKVSAVDFYGLFCADFDADSCRDGGLGFYTAGCALLGNRLESTYQYAPRPEIGEESYPYTPAAVMDAALQQSFAIPAESFHAMIDAYDAGLDGYWVPMGLGGLTVSTVVAGFEINGTGATLQCESRSDDPEAEDPAICSTVLMQYSEEHGWRFCSCTVH